MSCLLKSSIYSANLNKICSDVFKWFRAQNHHISESEDCDVLILTAATRCQTRVKIFKYVFICIHKLPVYITIHITHVRTQ